MGIVAGCSATSSAMTSFLPCLLKRCVVIVGKRNVLGLIIKL